MIEQEPAAPRLSHHGIPRDLETICLKCLAKEPARRYPTAAALADDIDRYLRHEPILARPVGLAGRLARWARRKPAIALLLLACTALAAAGIGGVVHQWRRALTNESAALANASKARSAEYDAAILLASHTLENGRTSQLRALLERTRPQPGKPDFRSWEWDYLKASPGSAELFTIGTHGSKITGIALSPDGTHPAANSADGKLRLWDIAGRSRIVERDLSGVNLPPVFSPDGKVLAVSGERTQLTLFSLPGMNQIAKLSDGAWISSVAFSEDSRHITAAGHSRTVTWKVASRQEEIARTDMPLSIGAVIRPGHGRALYSRHDMTALQLLGKNGLSQPWDIPSGRYLTSMQLSPDGSTALTAFNDNTVALWDTDTARLRHLLTGHHEAVLGTAFHPSQHLLATGGGDETILIWNTATGGKVRSLRGHNGTVQALDFSPDGTTPYSGSHDGTLRAWATEAGTQQQGSGALVPGYRGVGVSLKGTALIALHPKDRVIFQDFARVEQFEWQEEAIDTAALSPDATRAVYIRKAGTLVQLAVREGTTFKPVHDLRLACPVPAACVFDPTGRYFVIAAINGTATVCTVEPLEKVATFPCEWRWLRKEDLIEFSRDSSLVCMARGGSGYEVWDWRAAKRLLHIPSMGSNMQGAALSPDRRTAAVSIADRPIAVYDVRGESSVLRTEVSVFNARSLTFSPDGKRLAVGSENGGITVLNSDSLLPVLTLRANYFPVFSLRFTPDGTALTTVSAPILAWWSSHP